MIFSGNLVEKDWSTECIISAVGDSMFTSYCLAFIATVVHYDKMAMRNGLCILSNAVDPQNYMPSIYMHSGDILNEMQTST
jgi:hypothetical protein